jgi:hypothetical protein
MAKKMCYKQDGDMRTRFVVNLRKVVGMNLFYSVFNTVSWNNRLDNLFFLVIKYSVLNRCLYWISSYNFK